MMMPEPIQDSKFSPNEWPADEAELQRYLDSVRAKVVSQQFVETDLPQISGLYPYLFYRGDLSFLTRPNVAVVGTRAPSAEGVARAQKVTSALVELGMVVMSGLAKGIDAVAHSTALERGGKTVAVMGTPIHKVYPAEHRGLAERIVQNGLLLSPSLPHEEKGRYLFPRRNRLMAQLSVATVIIEAGETSGVVHQAAECLRQGRTLIFLKPLVDNPSLTWPEKFVKSGAKVATTPNDLKDLLSRS